MPDALTADHAPALRIAAPLQPAGDRAGLAALPTEWDTVDGVVLEDVILDHVVVGPNGVFAIAIDPDPDPTDLHDDGLYRHGSRLTTVVKSILLGAHALRARVGDRLFAYPMLVTPVTGPAGHLDRLGVVPPGGIPEAIWQHPGRPLTRSQRLEIMWTLRSLAD